MKCKYFTAAMLLLIFVTSCSKEESVTSPVKPPPETISINLGGQEVKYGALPVLLDFDNDGTRDFIFSVWLVGDPLLQVEKREFKAGSGVNSLFAVNSNQEVPCMNRGDLIPLNDFNGYSWNLVQSVSLIERWQYTAGGTDWFGNWKAAVHKYLPFKMILKNKLHTGWIELSIDITAQKIILHTAAYSKEPEKEIKAGY